MSSLPPFRPVYWLRNAHLQSILPSLPPRLLLTRRGARPLRRAAQAWLLDCGAGVRLQAWHSLHPSPNGRVAVLLHGWEGSYESNYVLSLGATLYARGYHVVRLNLRDHGGTQNLNQGLFHSCRLSDVTGALRALAEHCGDMPLYLAGFSLGGNFLLRAAAEPRLPATVRGVVAISPVLDPARTLTALERGWRLYHRYFVERWSRSLRIKQRLWPSDYDFTALLRSRDLRHMTAELVRAHTQFPDIAAYLDGYALLGARLSTLSVAASILAAADDPIIPVGDLERLAASRHLSILRTAHGGHCGFLRTLLAPGFADQYTCEQFEHFVHAESAVAHDDVLLARKAPASSLTSIVST